MTGAYGKGQVCPAPGSPLLKYAKAAPKSGTPCLHLEDLSRVLAKSRDFGELVEAWRGWHATAAPMKDKYARYVELANAGAREIGFADVGALWRAGYDMPSADFEADVERLWADVKPLYAELHCYVRAKLHEKYGRDKVSGSRAHSRRATRQHVGTRVEHHRRSRDAISERALARRDEGARIAALGRREKGAQRRAILHRTRLRSAATDVLGASAVHASARPRSSSATRVRGT